MRKHIVALFLTFSMAVLFSQQTAFMNTYIELKQSVIDFREDGLPYCVRNGVMVNPAPSELKVGDVFIDVDGNARQVTSVQRDGSELFIDTVQPDLSQVINYADIPDQTINFTEDNFLPETLAGGDLSSVMAGSSPRASSSYGVSAGFEKEFANKSKTVTINAKGKAALTGSVDVSAKMPYSKRWRRYDGYVNGSFNYSLKVDSSVTVTAQKDNDPESQKKLLYGFGTSGSVSAGLGLYFQPILEGSVVLTIPLSAELAGSASAGCSLDKWLWYPKDAYSKYYSNLVVTVSPTLEADGKFTAKFFVGTDISIFGINAASFEAGGGPYAHFNGLIEVDGVKYDRNAKKLAFLEDGITITGSGELGICCKVAGSIYKGKWGFELLNEEYPFIKAGWDKSKGGWYWTSPFKTAYMPDGTVMLVDARGVNSRGCVMLPYRCLVPMTAVREDKTI